jgi:hypothetical protein
MPGVKQQARRASNYDNSAINKPCQFNNDIKNNMDNKDNMNNKDN